MSEFWEDRYSRAVQAGQLLFPKGAAVAVTQVLDTLPNGNGQLVAIDAGAGEGRHSRELVRHGYRVIATEVSPTAVKAGHARFLQADGLGPGNAGGNLLATDFYEPVEGVRLSEMVSWQLGDARTWTPEEPVDLVLGAFIHQVEGGIETAVANMASWVKPGGRIVFVGHSRDQFGRNVGGPRNPAMLWKADELAADLQSLGFIIERAEDVERADARFDEHCSVKNAPQPDAQRPVDTIVVALRPTD